MQRGFSIVYIILVVAALALVGLIYSGRISLNTPNTNPTTNSEKMEAGETSGRKLYINGKHNYQINYPKEISINRGPLTDDQLLKTDVISFDGFRKNLSDVDSGASFYINANVLDSYNKPISCSTDEECLEKWKIASGIDTWAKKVKDVEKVILGKKRKGEEYLSFRDSPGRTDRIFVFFEQGKVWYVNLSTQEHHKDSLNTINNIFDEMINSFKTN